MTDSINAKRPTHTILQVIDGPEKSHFHRVGAGWLNRDGKGLNLVFESMPLVGRIVVREISEQEQRTGV